LDTAHSTAVGFVELVLALLAAASVVLLLALAGVR
jgi:hypothetical protein